MSAGEFTRTFYELDSGNGGGVASIRVQPETISATVAGVVNSAPEGPATVPSRAKVSKSRRQIGIGARKVTLEFTGTPPTGYSGEPVTIPVLQASTYASWTLGSTGTYLGADVEVIARSAEDIN